MRCAGCQAELEETAVRPERTAGDCHPLCLDCLRSLARRVRPTQRSLTRTLYAAGRSISRCEACGAEGGTEFHFLVPLVRGGTAESRNLLVLCPGCHLKVHQGARPVLRLRIEGNNPEGDCLDERDPHG
ncbi:HNH endonuclease [bacterium]|nr:HNH endonuclease [bacterium]